MDYQAIAARLLEALGGKNNIISNNACATRLRVALRDSSLADLDALERMDEVLAVVQADTLQVVLGPGVVNGVLDAFIKLTGIQKGQTADTPERGAARLARQNKGERSARYAGVTQSMLTHVANIFVPLLPGIVAAGLINGITNVINVSWGGALSGQWWYECVRTMGWALFAYLPIFAGYNSARECGGSPVLGGIAGAICVANAAMPLLAQQGGSQVVLPMTGAAYNPSTGGLLASMLAGALFAGMERALRRVMPKAIDTFITPFVVLVAGGLLVVVALQPLGELLTRGVFTVMNFVYGTLGVVGGFILSAGFLPLVSVGLHQALTPIHAMLNDPAGPTAGINYLLPVLMMAGGGQIGAGIALYVRTKNTQLKGYIRDSVPVGMLGVGEPLMYAVTLPLGRPFVTACLGAGFGGALSTAFHVGVVSQGVSGLFGLLIVQPGQQLLYLVALLAACAGGFVLTWLFGVDEKRINEVYGSAHNADSGEAGTPKAG